MLDIKKPIQNRAVHKRLAHVDRGRRLLGAEQQHRQTGGMPTQSVSDKNPDFDVGHSTTEQLLHAVFMSSWNSSFSISFIQFWICVAQAVKD